LGIAEPENQAFPFALRLIDASVPKLRRRPWRAGAGSIGLPITAGTLKQGTGDFKRSKTAIPERVIIPAGADLLA